jgi:hypothetical protein
MSSYEVTISENIGKTILVEANSRDEAWGLIDSGEWDESMVIKEKLIDRMTCDVDEVKDKNLARGFKND